MSKLRMVQRWAAGVAGATVLLSGCTGTHSRSAEPAPAPSATVPPSPAASLSPPLGLVTLPGSTTAIPVATIWPSTGGRPPLTAAAAEQQVRGVAEQGGDAPTVDRLISTVDDGPRHRFVWPVRDGGLCWGDYSPFGIARACFTATDLPTGPVPGLRTLGSGILDDGTWYTEFLASQEEVVRVTCNGSELLPSRAGTVDTADGSRTIYTLITPWQMRGQLPATVVRAGATTTDRLAVGGSTPLPKNDPRFRECA